ncbi:hypothetical protein OVA24_15540 [Luteolibacter sp. SL250]|uniref:hypothetical protein n=1 Tax=Luteolibacter sp. SL250 TaxID=2995170 RepID=UPI00226DB345|nr:hypothetical protein [Luteolibacter sp. SL250]WAC18645.1 hypothetical protein OVA24_15540 [Luteolibacter sp. SL250]
MKALLAIAAAISLTALPAHAIFSQFMVLHEDSYRGEHAKYRPTLRVNEKDPDFIDVRIPYVDDGLSYWLVVANESIETKKLEFRSIVWGEAPPKYVQSVARLGESTYLWESPPKRRGFIDFTIRKEILDRCYVYHDYDFPLDDGGFYYTYHLSKHKIQPAGTDTLKKPEN